MTDVGDVDAAAGQVCGDQHVEFSGAEILHNAVALVLGEVAVNLAAFDSVGVKLTGDFFRAALGAAKYDRQLRIFPLQQHPQQRVLIPRLDGKIILLNSFDGRLVIGARSNQFFHRLAHVLPREFVDLV